MNKTKRILSVAEASELAQKANSDYIIENYINIIQDKYFCLDKDELIKVLNRLTKSNVLAGKSRFVIDADLLCNEFMNDGKLNSFECKWKTFRVDHNLESRLPLLTDSRVKQKMERKLRQSKHSDSIYLYDKLEGRSAISNLLMGKRPVFSTTDFVTKISNANRYISLAQEIFFNEGYEVSRPYFFSRMSKIIVSLPNPERFRRHIQDSRRK